MCYTLCPHNVLFQLFYNENSLFHFPNKFWTIHLLYYTVYICPFTRNDSNYFKHTDEETFRTSKYCVLAQIYLTNIEFILIFELCLHLLRSFYCCPVAVYYKCFATNNSAPSTSPDKIEVCQPWSGTLFLSYVSLFRANYMKRRNTGHSEYIGTKSFLAW